MTTRVNKTIPIGHYNFKSADKLLLDTNVWLLLYGPQNPTDPRVKTYSSAFSKILEAKSNIYIDVLIVSEFINTYSRQKYNLLANLGETFKNFRKSKEFKPVACEIADMVKRIIKHCSQVNNDFEKLSVKELIDEYAAGASDFNDQILTELCKKEKLTLVTDDSDFKGQEISILTANKKMFRD